jgi:hypothetical protein
MLLSKLAAGILEAADEFKLARDDNEAIIEAVSIVGPPTAPPGSGSATGMGTGTGICNPNPLPTPK